MRRILKGNIKSLEGVYLQGEDSEGTYAVQYNKDNVVEVNGEEITIQYRDRYILTLKETEKCWFYDLKREIKEEVEEENKLFINENTSVGLSLGEFYNSEFEEAIFFETEEEMGLAFARDNKVYIPLIEKSNMMYCNIYDYKKFVTNEFDTIRIEKIEGFLCYLGMSNNDIGSENIKIRETKHSSTTYTKKGLYKFAKLESDCKTNYYLMHEADKIKLITKYIMPQTSFYTTSDIDDIPDEANILWEKYISKKKTKGITDKINNPFGWLNY